MLFAMLTLIALGLLIAMFATKQMMLGFPSAIFWAILGGYCYTLSTATWDLYYFFFFASMGMAIFSVIAMYALRTKKEELAEGDEFIDEGKDNMTFIDEKEGRQPEGEEDGSPRQRAIRRRSKARSKNSPWWKD